MLKSGWQSCASHPYTSTDKNANSERALLKRTLVYKEPLFQLRGAFGEANHHGNQAEAKPQELSFYFVSCNHNVPKVDLRCPNYENASSGLKPGDRKKVDDWFEREMWIAKNGA